MNMTRTLIQCLGILIWLWLAESSAAQQAEKLHSDLPLIERCSKKELQEQLDQLLDGSELLEVAFIDCKNAGLTFSVLRHRRHIGPVAWDVVVDETTVISIPHDMPANQDRPYGVFRWPIAVDEQLMDDIPMLPGRHMFTWKCEVSDITEVSEGVAFDGRIFLPGLEGDMKRYSVLLHRDEDRAMLMSHRVPTKVSTSYVAALKSCLGDDPFELNRRVLRNGLITYSLVQSSKPEIPIPLDAPSEVPALFFRELDSGRTPAQGVFGGICHGLVPGCLTLLQQGHEGRTLLQLAISDNAKNGCEAANKQLQNLFDEWKSFDCRVTRSATNEYVSGVFRSRGKKAEKRDHYGRVYRHQQNGALEPLLIELTALPNSLEGETIAPYVHIDDPQNGRVIFSFCPDGVGAPQEKLVLWDAESGDTKVILERDNFALHEFLRIDENGSIRFYDPESCTLMDCSTNGDETVLLDLSGFVIDE